MKYLFIMVIGLFFCTDALTQKSPSATAVQPPNIAMTLQIPITKDPSTKGGPSSYGRKWASFQVLKTKQPDKQALMPNINSLDVFLTKAIQEKKLIVYYDSLCTKPFTIADYTKLQVRIEHEKCFEKLEKYDENTENFPRATAIYNTLFYDSLQAKFLVSLQSLGFYYYDTVLDSSTCGFSCDKSAPKIFWLPIFNTNIDMKNEPNITFAKRLFYEHRTVAWNIDLWYKEIYKLNYKSLDTIREGTNFNNQMTMSECLEHQAKTLSARADSLIIYRTKWMDSTVPYKQKRILAEEWVIRFSPDTYEEIVTLAPLNFRRFTLSLGLEFYWDHQAGKLWARQYAQGLVKDSDENGNHQTSVPWYYILR